MQMKWTPLKILYIAFLKFFVLLPPGSKHVEDLCVFSNRFLFSRETIFFTTKYARTNYSITGWSPIFVRTMLATLLMVKA
jgi:hypothetical protein